MRFEIDFNREQDKDWVLDIIAEKGQGGNYFITLNTFEDMEKLEQEINRILNTYYSLIVGFDNPTIYIDKDI